MSLACKLFAMPPKKFPRVLLKLSGESLSASGEGVDAAVASALARDIAAVNQKGIALAIVIGGGNIWRFRDNTDCRFLPRERSDYLGMLATVMNGVVLERALIAAGVHAVAFSAVPAPEIVRPYSIDVANDVLKQGGIVIATGGTSRPYFTTDTAAALRAVELSCQRVLKATNVDGVYDADPRKHKNAKLLKTLSFAETIEKKLGVMDTTAFALLAEHRIPISIFNFEKRALFFRAARGENVGTIVS